MGMFVQAIMPTQPAGTKNVAAAQAVVLHSPDLWSWSIVSSDDLSKLTPPMAFIEDSLKAIPPNDIPAFGPAAFVNLPITPGWNLVANQLVQASNTIEQLFYRPPIGAVFHKVGPTGFSTANYLDGWSQPQLELNTGEAAYLWNPLPTNWINTFVGGVALQTTNVIPAGWSLTASIVPLGGELYQYIPSIGDQVKRLTNGMGLATYEYVSPGLWLPDAPQVRYCEGFWLYSPSMKMWTQELHINLLAGVGAETEGGRVSAFANTNAPFQAAFQLNLFTYHFDRSWGRVLAKDAATPLGTGYSGQFYVGSSNREDALAALGQPIPFLDGSRAGYLDGGLVTIPEAVFGAPVFVQLRAWDSASGSSFEAAVRNGGASGKSEVFALVYADPMLPPPQANRFRAFSVVDAPAPGELTFSTSNLNVRAGEELVVPVCVSDFRNIGVFQWSLHWSNRTVEFVGLEDLGLAGLGLDSFGTAQTSDGTLTVAWDDPGWTGQTLPDGSQLFGIRMRGVGTPGETTAIWFDGEPTPAAAMNAEVLVVPVRFANGSLTIDPRTPPVLGTVGDRTVDELSPLTFTATATSADAPPNELRFSLSGAPLGASIDPGTGVFVWAPTEEQGPGVYSFEVMVSDSNADPLTDSETIRVTVNEVNLAPRLPDQTNRVVAELTTLVVTNTATDGDRPANALVYELIEGPRGAMIDPSGVIVWTLLEADGPGHRTFTTVVSDDGHPVLRATNRFIVTIADTDGDGLPDHWETAHNLDPHSPEDATQDSDGDRSNNLEEFVAGTDPQNPDSAFKIQSAVVVDGTGAAMSLVFEAAAEKSYSLQTLDSVGTGPWLTLTNIGPLDSNRVITVRDSDATGRQCRFYRLVTPASR